MSQPIINQNTTSQPEHATFSLSTVDQKISALFVRLNKNLDEILPVTALQSALDNLASHIQQLFQPLNRSI